METDFGKSVRLQISAHEKDLIDLTKIMSHRELSRHEYLAGERLLQTLIECCIGVAKQWCRKSNLGTPSTAEEAFQRLHDKGIEDASPSFWRSVIGTRNALVHDYLNIDQEVIESLIRDKRYLSLTKFARSGLSQLES